MTAVPEPSDAVGAIQQLTDLSETEALRIEVKRQRARANFMAAQVAKAWAETRHAIRERDAALSVPCTLSATHHHGPTCGRCGTRPDGTVG